MEYLALTLNLVILALLIIFNIYMYHALFASRFGKYPPYVPTSSNRRKIVIDKISEYVEKSSRPLNIIDAGSGTGDILIPLARKCPNHKCIGIEWSWWPYTVSKLRAKKLKNAEFIHGDIFNHDFGGADVIYCYIVKNFAKPLADKIMKEAEPNCLVVTNGILFEEMVFIEEIKTSEKWLTEGIFIHRVK